MSGNPSKNPFQTFLGAQADVAGYSVTEICAKVSLCGLNKGEKRIVGFPGRLDPLAVGYKLFLDCDQNLNPEFNCVFVCASTAYYFESFSEQNKLFGTPLNSRRLYSLSSRKEAYKHKLSACLLDRTALISRTPT